MVTNKKNAQEQRRSNAYLILKLMKQNKEVTRAALADMSGFSKPTVTDIVEYLFQMGLLSRKEKLGRAGREVYHFSLEEGSFLFMGFGLYRSRVVGVLSTLTGSIVRQFNTHIDLKTDFNKVLSHILSEANSLIEEETAQGKKVLGLGIGVPGIIDRQKNRILKVTDFDDLSRIDIYRKLQDEFGLPVFMQHNINLAAFSEYQLGAGRGKENFIFVSLGEGIGSSIFYQGHILTGNMFMQGEIGHCSIDRQGLKCKCGSRGCVELYAKRSVLRSQIEQNPQNRQLILEDAASKVAGVIANTVCLTGINSVIIGGSTLFDYPEFFEIVKNGISDGVLPALVASPEISSASLNVDASALGAALYVSEIALYNLELFFTANTTNLPLMTQGIV